MSVGHGSAPRRWDLGWVAEVSGLAPVVGIAGLIVWLALQPGYSARGGLPPASEEPPATLATKLEEKLFLIAVTEPLAIELAEMVAAESALRDYLQEAPRDAVVVTARDRVSAETIWEAIWRDASLVGAPKMRALVIE